MFPHDYSFQFKTLKTGSVYCASFIEPEGHYVKMDQLLLVFFLCLFFLNFNIVLGCIQIMYESIRIVDGLQCATKYHTSTKTQLESTNPSRLLLYSPFDASSSKDLNCKHLGEKDLKISLF